MNSGFGESLRINDSVDGVNVSDVSLEYVEWKEFIDKGLPFTVFLSLLSVVGTLGNAMVFLTNLKSNKPSNYRILIQCLAFIDFLSCAVGIPGYVLMARYMYTIDSDIFCQISTVFHFFVGICSLTLLSFTAIERFRKTCQPFGKQFSCSEIKKVCVCLNVFAFLLSAPSAFTFHSAEVPLLEDSLVGHICKLNKDRIFSKVYIFIFVFCLLFCIFINTVFYSLIGRTIILQTKRGPKTVSFRNRFTAAHEDSSDQKYITNDEHTEQFQLKNRTCSLNQYDNENYSSAPPRSSRTCTQGHRNAPNRNISLKGKALYEKSVQISVMFLVCSLLSCASFVPLLVFRCISIYDFSLRERTFEAIGSMAPILNRFHVINHVINPIVYCLLSSNFRTECISLFRCKYK